MSAEEVPVSASIAAEVTRPDVGPVDVVKSKCQGECCTSPDFKPMQIVVSCPNCGLQHVDVGEWATRKHKKHRCVDPVLCSDGLCKTPVCHVETFNTTLRGWCNEHVPMSGHYEYCPVPCTKLVVELKRGCGYEWQPSLLHTVGVKELKR